MPEEFDVDSLLSTTTFTIPIEVEVNPTAVNMKPTKKKLMVTYDFSKEVNEGFNNGKMEDVEQESGKFDESGKPIMETVPKKRSLTLNEQCLLMVKGIEGVSKELTLEFWEGVFPRYKTTIIRAILRDVYPNAKTSMD